MAPDFAHFTKFCAAAVLALAAACQSTPDSVPAPPPQAAVAPQPADAPTPDSAPEQEAGGAPIVLTPANEGREQLAAYAPSPEIPAWRRPDGAPGDPAETIETDPCGDHGGIQLGARALAGSVVTSPGPYVSPGGVPSPRIGSLRGQVPASLHSPVLRRLIRRHLGTTERSRATKNLAGAEQAAAAGTISYQELGQLYRQTPFEPEELEAPLTDALEKNSPRRRALLYHAASGQQVPTAIAEVMKVALELARPAGLYEMTIGLYAPYIRRFEASFALRWIGYEVGPAQFYLGEPCKARNWRRYLESIAPNDPDARRVIKRFWVWEALSGVVPVAQIDPEEIKNWVRNLRGQTFGRRKIQLAYGMVAAFGGRLAVSDWGRTISAVQRQGGGARLAELEQAAQQSHIDEVAALSAIIVGARHLNQVSAGQAAKIISALSQVGLAEDARNFAVEMAIANKL